MKNKSEPEMRPEYDFSQARRSRYASRLSDQDRSEILKRSAVLDAQLQLGRALQEVQGLEAVLVASLVLGLKQALDAAASTAAAVLEGRDRGAVLELASEGALKGDFLARFGRLMEERNWLIHKSRVSGSPEAEGPKKLAELSSRLEVLSELAAEVATELRSALHHRLVNAGLTTQEVEERTRETIQRWLAA